MYSASLTFSDLLVYQMLFFVLNWEEGGGVGLTNVKFLFHILK